MKLKTSLHIHTKEDKKDGHMIRYDVFKLIDTAVERGFHVLGYTPHNRFVFKEEYARYALDKGVLLIPGVERELGRVLKKHVLILNCDSSAEKVKNLKQLKAYKAKHPESLIVAPHPTYNRMISIGAKNLKKNIDSFDAIEHSALYTKRINANKKARKIAKQKNKPMIATGDVHRLRRLDCDYAMIDADDFTVESVIQAIKAGKFENITEPKTLRYILYYSFGHVYRFCTKYLTVKIPLAIRALSSGDNDHRSGNS